MTGPTSDVFGTACSLALLLSADLSHLGDNFEHLGLEHGAGDLVYSLVTGLESNRFPHVTYQVSLYLRHMLLERGQEIRSWDHILVKCRERRYLMKTLYDNVKNELD